MNHKFALQASGWSLALLAIVANGFRNTPSVEAAQEKSAGPTGLPSLSSERAQEVLKKYCFTCHNSTRKTAGLVLDSINLSNPVGAEFDARTLEKVALKLSVGEMPPIGAPRPDPEVYGALRSWLESTLDQAALRNPNAGRPDPFRRLNRSEYQRVIRDLLALEVGDRTIDEWLPADDVSHGFDNTAGVRMSPMLMERYLNAAEKVSRLAVGATPGAPGGETFSFEENRSQNEWVEGLPFGTRGGGIVTYNFPADGTYEIRVRLARYNFVGSGAIPEYPRPQPLEVRLDGQRAHVFTQPAKPAGSRVRRDGDLDKDWNLRIAVKAGSHRVAFAWLNRVPQLTENPIYTVRPYPGALDTVGGLPYYTNRRGASIKTVEIVGPFDAAGPRNTPSQDRIFVCRPPKPADEPACAETIIGRLAQRAYRRPVTANDLKPLLAFYEQGRRAGGFEMGIEEALRAILVSRHFLFRVHEPPSRVPPNSNYPISDLELASQLSFFLWSSIPDDELLTLATRGELRRPGVIERQVARMLADSRSEALVKNFGGQWLFLRNVPGIKPDSKRDPDFDADLQDAFRRETELLFESIIRENASVLDLLTANYTFVNERLALHYGIPQVSGSQFRRVALTDDRRRGLLGQGSFLAITSYAHRTSPVQRGRWVLDNLLGSPPPPPPPDVPFLNDTKKVDGKAVSMRELMKEHRSNPTCATCHARMDPIGLALEQFDFVGRLRTLEGDSETPIDAAGMLPSGEQFDGVVGLRDALLRHSDRIVETLTDRLITYALGRGVEYYDMPAVRAIRRAAGADGYRFTSIVTGVVTSAPFQMRRSGETSVGQAVAAR